MIEFKRTSYAGHVPEIWRGECRMLPGGFKPVQSFPNGTVINRGTLLCVDFETMSAAVVKAATVLAGGTTKSVRVAKGSLFQAGDVITKVGDGASTPSISSIDSSNASYDVLVLSAAYAGIAEGDIIVESAAVTEGTASAKYVPNMVLGAVAEFDGKGIPTLDAAYEAVVLYPSVNYPLVADWFNGPCLKANPNILFIRQ